VGLYAELAGEVEITVIYGAFPFFAIILL
jgi:hypothetical protein